MNYTKKIPAKKIPEYTLHIPPKTWSEFRQAMLESRHKKEEVIGFFFCQRHEVKKNQIRYFPKFWVVPSSDCYEYQSKTGLVLKQEFHNFLLENYVTQGLHIVHIHTHLGESQPYFSAVDDSYESEYARFLSSYSRQKPRLISGVFNESLQKSQFRIWDRQGMSFQEVKCCHSWFSISDDKEDKESKKNQNPQNPNFWESNSNNIDLMFARQNIFGNNCQKILGELTVTLIGCGGIGSIFAELLGRLGVKKWILIDPDRLEEANLNRMVATTQEMAHQQLYKVDYVKQLIKRIYHRGAHIQAIPISIENPSINKEIAASDLIVVATDNHHSRQIAQELALKYMRPLVCLGTHIDVKFDFTPRMYSRITIPPMGGDWCLMCGNIINLQKAALEKSPFDIYNMGSNAGYLDGINDPSVFWLNSICASTAVGIIHGIVSGFLNIDSGIDWIFEFPESNWRKTNTDFLKNTDCYFCGSSY
jgi:molybdopterin-synthase adenylyltransferase